MDGGVVESGAVAEALFALLHTEIVRCCQVPRMSTTRRSTFFIPSAVAILRTSPADGAIVTAPPGKRMARTGYPVRAITDNR